MFFAIFEKKIILPYFANFAEIPTHFATASRSPAFTRASVAALAAVLPSLSAPVRYRLLCSAGTVDSAVSAGCADPTGSADSADSADFVAPRDPPTPSAPRAPPTPLLRRLRRLERNN